MKHHHTAALALGLLALGGVAIAASPAETIKARQANFKVLGKSMKAINGELKADSPNLATIKAAAADIGGAAPKIAGYFPKGTETGEKTEALPAIWQKPGEFKAAAAKLVAASKDLNAAAASGDVAKIKVAFGAVGGTCKGCHDNFKAKD